MARHRREQHVDLVAPIARKKLTVVAVDALHRIAAVDIAESVCRAEVHKPGTNRSTERLHSLGRSGPRLEDYVEGCLGGASEARKTSIVNDNIA
jgi:hypothetical protein